MHTSILLIAFLGPTKADYICYICEFAKWLNFFATLSSVVDWFALNTATPPASLTSCTSPHNTIDQHVFFCRQAVLSRFMQRNNSIHTREMLGLLGWIGRPMRLQGVRSSLRAASPVVFLFRLLVISLFSLSLFSCWVMLLGLASVWPKVFIVLTSFWEIVVEVANSQGDLTDLRNSHDSTNSTNTPSRGFALIYSLVQRLKSIRTSWI